MNIAIISHPSFPIPPYDGYGGVQRGIYDLAIGLANRGHRVYVFCTKTSKIKHKNVYKIDIIDRGTAEDDACAVSQNYLDVAFKNISDELDKLIADNKIDVINVRWEDKQVQEFCKSKGLPILMSVHCLIPSGYANYLYDEDLTYTFHTATHMKHHPEFKNGVINDYAIRMDHIPTSVTTLSECIKLKPDIPKYLYKLWLQRSDYLVYISGIRKPKSQASAIDIAKRANLPIVIAGSPTNQDDKVYFNRDIKPMIDNETVIYIPNVNESEKYNLLKYAKGFIFSAGQEVDNWSEPFGRVISESLATGTPVIGYKYGGSIVHQVVHGKNGFLYKTSEEAAGYIKNLSKINRENVAKDARERLNVEKFIAITEETLESVIER